MKRRLDQKQPYSIFANHVLLELSGPNTKHQPEKHPRKSTPGKGDQALDERMEVALRKHVQWWSYALSTARGNIFPGMIST